MPKADPRKALVRRAILLGKELGLEPFQVEEILARAIIRARPGRKLVVADINAIEARMAAYLSGDYNLDLFREDKDIYCAFASKLFGFEVNKKEHPDQRFVGKQSELMLAYGAGGTKFAAAVNPQMKPKSLADFGLDPWSVVYSWRDAHPKMAGVWNGKMFTNPKDGMEYRVYEGGWWRELNSTARLVIETGQPAYVGILRFEMQGPNSPIGSGLHVVSPDGHRLVYRDAAVEEVPGLVEGYTRKAIVFTKSVSKGSSQRIQMYPGRWAENVTQWLCWVLFNIAHTRLENSGLDILLPVHDELVAEEDEPKAEEALDLLLSTMVQSPEWASDLPLKAEGWIGDYYTKEPRSDWPVKEMMG